MGYYFKDEFDPNRGEFEINDDILMDLEEQVKFLKDKFLDEDIELVSEVLKRMCVGIVQGMSDEASAQASIPMITAFSEAMIELRLSNDALRAELIEKNVPPPEDFKSN